MHNQYKMAPALPCAPFSDGTVQGSLYTPLPALICQSDQRPQSKDGRSNINSLRPFCSMWAHSRWLSSTLGPSRRGRSDIWRNDELKLNLWRIKDSICEFSNPHNFTASGSANKAKSSRFINRMIEWRKQIPMDTSKTFLFESTLRQSSNYSAWSRHSFFIAFIHYRTHQTAVPEQLGYQLGDVWFQFLSCLLEDNGETEGRALQLLNCSSGLR